GQAAPSMISLTYPPLMCETGTRLERVPASDPGASVSSVGARLSLASPPSPCLAPPISPQEASHMHRTLERLDGAASTIVPLAYLGALFLGTAAYFTGIFVDLGVAVGLGVACAAEVHAFLEQRRARAARQALRRVLREDPRWLALRDELRLHVAILV